MEIKEENRNGLFNRNEVLAIMSTPITPKLEEAKKELADHFKVDEKLVVIETVKGNFGSQDFKVKAKIYDSLEDRNSIETKLAREEAAAEKAAKEAERKAKIEAEAAAKAEAEAAKAAEEAPAETPAEEGAQ